MTTRREEMHMADPLRDPDTGEDAGVAADRGSPPRMPRWVKVSGIIVAVLVLLVVILMLISGGGHGPRRHASSGGLGGQAPLSSATAELTLSGGGLGDHTPSEASYR
jgi:hypothetical protein